MSAEGLNVIYIILGIISISLNMLIILVKPFRNWLLGLKKDRQEKEEAERRQIETDKCLLRDRILDIYYKHNITKEINFYEYEDAAYMYEQYKKLGGNSFVDKIWKEMQTWDVIA